MGTTDKDADRILAETVEDWAAWLDGNHTRRSGVWLLTWRPGSGRQVLGYEDAVVEALRYGWIDGKGGKGDTEHREQWFSPRRKGSAWARSNKERIARLEREGRLEPGGRRVVEEAQADGTWTLLDDAEALVVPPDLAAAFDDHPGARARWDGFPPSARMAILAWIITAKRPETRARRVLETAGEAAQGRRANERRATS